MQSTEPMKSPIPFRHVLETGSTNQDLLDSVGSGEPSPMAILTDSQTTGRGRLGRVWHNEPRSTEPVQAMLGSVRQDWASDTESMGLTPFAAGLAVLSATSRWVDGDRSLELKWPNDVVIENPNAVAPAAWFHKVAGVLVEATPIPNSDQTAVIVGVGLNLWPVTSSTDSTANADSSSLSELCSSPPTNVQLFQALLAELEEWTSLLRSDPIGLMDHYRAQCQTTGHLVRFVGADGPVLAEATRVANDGSLVVQTDSGETHAITAGDVHVER